MFLFLVSIGDCKLIVHQNKIPRIFSKRHPHIYLNLLFFLPVRVKEDEKTKETGLKIMSNMTT